MSVELKMLSPGVAVKKQWSNEGGSVKTIESRVSQDSFHSFSSSVSLTVELLKTETSWLC